MDERIKQLALQADKFAKENRTQTISGPGNNYFELFHEKFAELIVRGCASIAREIGNNTEPDDFALDRCYEIEDKIKQHFEASQ